MTYEASNLTTIPAPIKGWNTASPISQLMPDFAIKLENLICWPDVIKSRKGSVEHVVEAPEGGIKTLLPYFDTSGGELYGATDDGIFDVTSPGIIGAGVATCTQGYGVSALLSTSADRFLMFVNGTDFLKRYDGTTWLEITDTGTGAITGVPTDELNNLCVYRKRLFMAQAGVLGFWYLAVDSVAGAATFFNLGSTFTRGGELVGIATWTIDGGNGSDDFIAFASSNGEIAVFSGSDPGELEQWIPQGVYYVGRPPSRNCFQKWGGDLLYLCDAGVFPLSKALSSVSIDRTKAINSNIQPTIVGSVNLFFTNEAWSLIALPAQNLILVNAPLDGEIVQYVMQTQTKAWSLFRGLEAQCWVEFNNQVYFGTTWGVAQAFSGFNDFGDPIAIALWTAYSRLNTLLQLQPLQIRPVILCNRQISYRIGMARDFTDAYIMQPVETDTDTWAIADVSLWDVGTWGSSNRLQSRWRTVAASAGITQSIALEADLTDAQISIVTFDLRNGSQGSVM